MKIISRIYWTIIVCFILASCALPEGISETPEIARLKELAGNGDVESQYLLGLHYTIESKFLWDHSRGYRWLILAANQGHEEASYMVGMAKWNGKGTLYDQKGAIDYFRQAAFQGHMRAQYQLAHAYLDGVVVTQEKPWGRQWLEQAAWRGHREAQFLLGALFAKGVGGQINQAEAWRWLQRARENGQAQAERAIQTLESKLTVKELSLAKNLLASHQKIEATGLYDLPLLRYVQTVLNDKGFAVGVEDGLEGPMTRAAVTSYKQKNGLAANLKLIELAEHLRRSSR